MSTEYLDPKTVDLVIYHDKCPDGWGSAFAAWKLLGNHATYIGCADHNTTSPPDVKGRRVVILDFSFKIDVLRHMIQKADRLLVIDHHMTASDDLEQLDEKNKLFDMNHSGCVLSWNFFHPTTPCPLFLLFVEDRDLWKWNLKYSEEVCAGLDTVTQSFEEWDKLMSPESVQFLRRKGEPVLSYRDTLIESICTKSSERILNGVLCRVVNTCGASIVSNVGDNLLKQYNVPMAVMWYVDCPSKKFKVSLRSIPDFDCSEVARKFKGGGHKNSAAFSVSRDSEFWKEFESLIEP